MDVLSEVLRVVRLSGVVHFRAEFTRPWAIVSPPPEKLAPRLMPGAECIVLFHVVIAGGGWICCGALPPLPLEAGDVVVLPRGDQHVMTSDLGMLPVPIQSIFPAPSPDRIACVAHGGGGEATRYVCGYLHCDQRFNPLLEALPPLLRVRLVEGVVRLEAPGANAPAPEITGEAAQWWASTLRYTISEATIPGPGNREMLARLAELLFIEVLRGYMRSLAPTQQGWLAGLQDPQVGRALQLLHAEPARRWTVEALARQVALSRAVLAKRFVELVGTSPMQYLGGWRMHLAKRLLSDDRLALGEIAESVGYESETAFNRAFRRLVGQPPAQWRSSARIAPAGDGPARQALAPARAGARVASARRAVGEGAQLLRGRRARAP